MQRLYVKMQGLYVKRHDRAVKTLVAAFQKHSRGGWAVEYNAGTGEDGSTHAMVHERLLRSAHPHITTRGQREVAELDEEARGLLRLKPDVVIYQGLRQEELSEFLDDDKQTPPPRGMTIQTELLEVGNCNEWKWEKKKPEKESWSRWTEEY